MTDYSREYSLICEGKCNPNLSIIDADVRDLALRQAPRNAYMPAPDEDAPRQQMGDYSLWRALRTLKYTPHRMTAPCFAECLVCFHERRYGSISRV